MFWVEFYLVIQMASWFVLRSKIGSALSERLALSILLALGIKSILLFAYIGLELVRFIPSPVIFTSLVFLICFTWMKIQPAVLQNSLVKQIEKRGAYEYSGFLVLLILFSLSLVNAWIFPITGADGIWHHVKGMAYSQALGDFDSEQVIFQFRQYPPLIGLLYAWLISSGFERIVLIFPILYACLLVVFFFRIRQHDFSSKVAGMATLIVGTTPYLWWHSFLPFLDWTAGVFYAVGVLYWLSMIKNISISTNDINQNQNKSLAILSGLFLGLSSWTRPEFVIYSAIPLFLLICVLDRDQRSLRERNSLIIRFAVAILILPSLWFSVILNFSNPLDNTFKQLIMGCVGLWIGVALILWGGIRINRRAYMMVTIFTVLFGLLGVFFLLPPDVSPWIALIVRFFRLFAVHVFFMGTVFLMVFLFTENLRNLSVAEKTLGSLLFLFLLAQFFIYAYSGLKWPTLSHFAYNTFVDPGKSINLSDTRGTIAFYPLFVFFIFCLPAIKKRFETGRIRRFLLIIIGVNLAVILVIFEGPRVKFLSDNFEKSYKQLSETSGPFDLPNQFKKSFKIAHQLQAYVLKDQPLFLPSGENEGTFRSVMTQVLFWHKLTFADDSNFWRGLKKEGSSAYAVSLSDTRGELCYGMEEKILGDTGFSLCKMDKFSNF